MTEWTISHLPWVIQSSPLQQFLHQLCVCVASCDQILQCTTMIISVQIYLSFHHYNNLSFTDRCLTWIWRSVHNRGCSSLKPGIMCITSFFLLTYRTYQIYQTNKTLIRFLRPTQLTRNFSFLGTSSVLPYSWSLFGEIRCVWLSSWLDSWRFQPSQPQWITSGLNTKLNVSPSYSFHKSLCHKSLFPKPHLKLYPQFLNTNPSKNPNMF